MKIPEGIFLFYSMIEVMEVDRMKKGVALIIIFVCIFILSFDDFSNDYFYKKFEETVITEKEVLKCNSDIPEGYYDVEVLKGNISIGLNVMTEGEMYHNYFISKGSNLFIDHGKGKVKITMPERKLLKGNSFIKNYGNYVVGTDITKGTYRITLKNDYSQNNKLYVDLYENMNTVIDTYSFKAENDSTIMILKDNQMLSISRPLFDDFKENAFHGFMLEFELLEQ